MSHDPKVAGQVARIVNNWWTASALNEKAAAESFRAQLFSVLTTNTAATAQQVVDAFTAVHERTELWAEFLTAQANSDRKRIASAVAATVLATLPVKATKELPEPKKVKDPARGAYGTDPRYFEPRVPLSMALSFYVPFMLGLYLLTKCGS